MKRVFITLDCDPGESEETSQIDIEDSIKVCLRLFKRHNLTKSVTWFVNEAEVGFIENYGDLLKKMAEAEIGLHVHLNRPPMGTRHSIPAFKNHITEAIKRPKSRLEDWLHEQGPGSKLVSFRSGNLLTTPVLFEALDDLGFKIDSSIPAQFDWSPREVARRIMYRAPEIIRGASSRIVSGMAYKTLPIGTRPYMMKGLFEMPLHIYLGGRYADLEWLKKRTKTQLEKTDELVVYWHPYEIIQFGDDLYERYIEFLIETYSPGFYELKESIG